jgi:uncharacterized protein involved in exopolysaccharide biosynthesis
MSSEPASNNTQAASFYSASNIAGQKTGAASETQPPESEPHDFTARNQQQRGWLLGLMMLLIVIAVIFLSRKKSAPDQ